MKRPNIEEMKQKWVLGLFYQKDFDELMIYLAVLEKRYYFLNNTFEGTEERNCSHCKKPTRRIEVNFETHLCSMECCDAMWKEYEEACKVSDERHRIGPSDF